MKIVGLEHRKISVEKIINIFKGKIFNTGQVISDTEDFKDTWELKEDSLAWIGEKQIMLKNSYGLVWRMNEESTIYIK